MEIFKYCTFDNPIFKSALFWLGLFLVSGAFTLYYKMQESNERQVKDVVEKSPTAKKPVKTQAKTTTPAKAVAMPVAEVKKATAPVKKAEKVLEAKPKVAQKQVELKPVETPKPKETKAESKPKKEKAPKKKEEPVVEVEVTPEPVTRVQLNPLSENDIDDGWNLVEK